MPQRARSFAFLREGLRNSSLNRLLLLVAVLGPVRWGVVLGERELWHDEAYSLSSAAGINLEEPELNNPFTHADVMRRATASNAVSACLRNDGGNGILHVMLLQQWMRIAPSSVAGLRHSSFLVAFAALLVLTLLVLDIFGDARVALLAAALIAHNPLMVTAAIEIRSYPLALLFSSSAAWAMLRVVLGRPFKGDVLALAFLTAGSLLSHLSTGYVFAGLGLVAVLRVREARLWKKLVSAGAITSIVVAAWMAFAGAEGLPVLQKRNQEFQALVAANPEINTYFQATRVRSLVEGIGVHTLWASGNGLQAYGIRLRWLFPALAIPAGLILLMLRGKHGNRERLAKWCVLVLAASAIAYAAVLALISGHTISFQPRYALFSMPFVCVALALGMRAPGVLSAALGVSAFIALGATTLMHERPNDASPIGPDRYTERAATAVGAIQASGACEPSLQYRTWYAAVLFNLVDWPAQLGNVAQHVDKHESHFLTVALKEPCTPGRIVIWPRNGRHLRSEPRDPEDAPSEPPFPQ